MASLRIVVDLPAWSEPWEEVGRVFASDGERMQLAVRLARLNVEQGTGGPFGAAVFEGSTGRLVAIGLNAVVRLRNSALHAEVVACMRAQARLGSYTLGGVGGAHVLYSSCEPCAMCLGAILWSGVDRVQFAARRDDAQATGFDEGPVFPETFAYLRRRGVRVEGGPLRDEAREVLRLYRERGGELYNG